MKKIFPIIFLGLWLTSLSYADTGILYHDDTINQNVKVSTNNPLPVTGGGGGGGGGAVTAAANSYATNFSPDLTTLLTRFTGVTALDSSLQTLIALFPSTLGQKTMANSFSVTLASNQSALAITAAALPLPTGAALDSSLTTISGKLPTALDTGNLKVALENIPHVIVDSGGGGGDTSNITAIASPVNAKAAFVGGTDGTNLRGLLVSTAGRLSVDVNSGGGSNASVGSTGSSVPTSGTYIAGLNGGNLVGIAVDSTGHILLPTRTVKPQYGSPSTVTTVSTGTSATNQPVASSTGFIAGDIVFIGGATKAYRTISSIPDGTHITFTATVSTTTSDTVTEYAPTIAFSAGATLGSGSAYEAAALDNTVLGCSDISIIARFETGGTPATPKVVNLYIDYAYDGTHFLVPSSGGGGTNGTITFATPSDYKIGATINAVTASTVYTITIPSIRSMFGSVPPQIAPILENQDGQAFATFTATMNYICSNTTEQ